LDKEYIKLSKGQRRLEVALTGAMLVASYFAALRGKETPLIDLGMMRKYWAEGVNYERKPHVPLTLVGRFKQTNGAFKMFIQSLVTVSSSGVEIQLWLGRAIEEYHLMGVKTGPMFRSVNNKSEIRRAAVSDLD
jgi:hypothetical protein